MDIAGFLAVATLVIVTPGPDMTLVARNTFAGGRLSGLATSAGTCSGLFVHATAAALASLRCSWHRRKRSPS
jgi:threonine/homoserine/homoserine lactone efflux protein